MRADLHIHSTASYDSIVPPLEVLKIAKSRGLGAIAMLDHNTIEGSKVASEKAKDVGIVLIRGMEVSTVEGHVGCLGIPELIQKGLSAAETVEKIHAAGGIAIALHPYRIGTGIGRKVVEDCKFDAVEVVNGFTTRRRNRKARSLADSLDLPYTAGSDAHDPEKIGTVCIEIEECGSAEEVLERIRRTKAKTIGEGANFPQACRGAYELTRDWMKRGFKRL